MFFAEIVFVVSSFFVVYTYLFYPLILKFFARNKQLQYTLIPRSNLPTVSIIMAAYNEEKVIEQKIRSVFNSDYPNELIEFYVGSDCSNDKTNEILLLLEKEYPQLKVKLFTERQGKIQILNQFMKLVANDIVISTDANNIFFEDTIYEFVSVLADENIGLVDIKMLHSNLNNKGMSYQENTYISLEAKTKYYEGILFGAIVGPFGGCYAMRKKLWVDVPITFLNDDFFVNMSILNQNYKTVTNLNARVYEDVSNNPKLEFRRKIRISAGNFQNFFLFFKILINPFNKKGFVFFSHKVLRWFGPFFLLFIISSIIYLSFYSQIYFIALILTVLCIFLCFIDKVLRNFDINLFLIRHLTHFFFSNIAMIWGLGRYIKGIKTSVWAPTQRHQKPR